MACPTVAAEAVVLAARLARPPSREHGPVSWWLVSASKGFTLSHGLMSTCLQSPEPFRSNDPVPARRLRDPDPNTPKDEWLRVGLSMFLHFVALSLESFFFFFTDQRAFLLS